MLLKKLRELFKKNEPTCAKADAEKNELSKQPPVVTPVSKPEISEAIPVSKADVSNEVMDLMRARLEEDKEFRKRNHSMDRMEMKDRAATLLSDGWKICDEHLMLLLDDFGSDTEIARRCLENSLRNGGITQNQYMKALVILRQKAAAPFPPNPFVR